MNLKNVSKARICQSIVVVAMTIFMGITSVVGSLDVSNSTTSDEVAASGTTQKSHTAGIISALNNDEIAATEVGPMVDETGYTEVAEPSPAVAAVQELEEAEAEAEDEDDEWSDVLMADVNDYLYVREDATTEAPVVGKLRKGDSATIISFTEDGWFEIESGNLKGYVLGDYCVTGSEAEDLASEICVTYAKATTGGVRVRSEASQESKIITALGQGDKIKVDNEAEEVDGWVAVAYGNSTGYVSGDYVETYMDMGKGITKEEEAEAKAKAAQTTEATTIQNAAVAASFDDETLLAALIQCEAGGYDGELAVGAVVMNRLRSGRYGSSLESVIYAKGQFGPARSGAVARLAAKGPSATARAAAQAALSGIDPTGGCTHFQPARTGHAGVVIGGNVFF